MDTGGYYHNPNAPDYYGNASNCRLTNSLDKIYVRCLIPSRIAGSLIGKQGSAIKRMRQEFDVNVVIPESNNTERVILISKQVPEDCLFPSKKADYRNYLTRCCQVVKRVAEILQEAEVRFAGGNLSKLKSKLNMEEGPNVDIRLLFNESIVKYLQNEKDHLDRNYIEAGMSYSNVKEVRIFDEKCPESTDFVIKIVGQPEQIMDCTFYFIDNTFKVYRSLIENSIYEKHYNTANANTELCENYGGFNENNNQTADLRDLGKAALSTDITTVFAVDNEMFDKDTDFDTDFNKLKDSVVFRRGPPPAAPNFDVFEEHQNSYMDVGIGSKSTVGYNEHKATVCIPNEMAFHLIGVDGSRLKEIEKVSYFIFLIFSSRSYNRSTHRSKTLSMIQHIPLLPTKHRLPIKPTNLKNHIYQSFTLQITLPLSLILFVIRKNQSQNIFEQVFSQFIGA